MTEITDFIIKHALTEHSVKAINKAYKIIYDNVGTDLIVDDYSGLVDLVCNSDKCYISNIIMWERTKIGVPSHMGYGGPVDLRAPEEYFFSETIVEKNFAANSSKAEILEFIAQCKMKHPECDLYPGFNIFYC